MARPTGFTNVGSAAAASRCSIWRGTQEHEGPLPHPSQDQAHERHGIISARPWRVRTWPAHSSHGVDA